MPAARKLTASGRDRGRSLASFLAERLGLEPDGAAALVRAGGVYVGRARVEEPNRPLAAGERVVVHGALPTGDAVAGPAPAPIGGAAAGPASSSTGSAIAAAGHSPPPIGQPPAVAIVYEDADVLVIDKPAGVASQATRESALGAVDRLVAGEYPGARLFHRIDRAASGLVLFTRHADAHRRFAALLRGGRIERHYTAVAWGHLAADAGSFAQPIGPDPRDRRRMVVGGHGRPALTHYRVARRGRAPTGELTTLVELQLATGRTHQIRVHLAGAGHPLCGDLLYGPSSPPASVPRLCLHAHRLAWPGTPPVLSENPRLFDALSGPSFRR